MPFTEDLSHFFNTADFADEATYTPTGGQVIKVKGIYDADFIDPGLAIEIGEGGVQPSFICKSSDLPNPRHDDLLVVRGVAHKVVGVQPDGQGVTTLILVLI